MAGGLPATDPRLHSSYGAAGVNVSVPILNGKLYAARQTEAELRAQAADRDVENLTVQVSEQVRVAWLEANTAYRRLDVTARLVTLSGARSLRLAQVRYENGLGEHCRTESGAVEPDFGRNRGGGRALRLPDYTRGFSVSDGSIAMRRNLPASTVVALACMAGLSSCSKTHAAAEEPAHAAEAPPIVPVAKAARADLASDLVLTAEFEPYQQVDVMAKVAGYVGPIPVDIGDRVHAGQVLATLEIPEMNDDLATAAASIDQADSEATTASDELQRAQAAHELAHLSSTRIADVLKREPGLVPAAGSG